MAKFIKAASLDEVPQGSAKLVQVGDQPIAVFNVEGEIYAISNTCTHEGGPLSEGPLTGHEVTCPWHGAVFDVRTGKVLGPPADQNVASFPTRINGSDIEVEV